MITTHFGGKVALVTGAAGGIGRASALAFAREGAKVVVADLLIRDGRQTVQAITSRGGEAIFVQADVGKSKDVQRLIRRTIEHFGRLDFAHNNAGIEGAPNFTADCSDANWERVIRINLKGVWLCMKHEIPRMLEQGGGSIVNTASIAGLVGLKAFPAYVASKHGIVGLTKAAALEYARANIRINAICPGRILTAMTQRQTGGNAEAEAKLIAGEPSGRMGQPEEVAAAVVWLCSSAASFVTGHAMTVDGGYTAR
jgi:NAD(P)-dependent dehydrogenase (short-subunit alcohol dehydrogenase family)